MSNSQRDTEEDNDVYHIDVNKLILLVEARPVLYDTTLKNHYNVHIINKYWQEIGAEMNAPGNICKTKWTNLRNSYNRYLRTVKKMPSGAAPKKKYYLAEAISFLNKFAPSYTTKTTNLASEPEIAPSMLSKEESTVLSLNKEEDLENETVHSVKDYGMSSTSKSDEIQPKRVKRKTSADLVAAPMIEFLKAATEQHKQHEEVANDVGEDPTLTFFRSLVPDINCLSERRKRKLKATILNTLNNLLDEQEDELYADSRLESTSSSNSAQYPVISKIASINQPNQFGCQFDSFNN